MPQIKAILFDNDGVVIHSPMFSHQYEKEFGYPAEKMLAFFKGPFTKCLVGASDLKEEVTPYVKEWGWTGSVDEFLAFWFQAENHPDTSLVDYIRSLRQQGIPCYLATNQEKYRTAFLRNEMDFKNIFDKVYSSTELGHKKPSPEFFEAIIADISKAQPIDPGEILFCDDTLENIEAAKKLGFQTYHYGNLVELKALITSST